MLRPELSVRVNVHWKRCNDISVPVSEKSETGFPTVQDANSIFRSVRRFFDQDSEIPAGDQHFSPVKYHTVGNAGV